MGHCPLEGGDSEDRENEGEMFGCVVRGGGGFYEDGGGYAVCGEGGEGGGVAAELDACGEESAGYGGPCCVQEIFVYNESLCGVASSWVVNLKLRTNKGASQFKS